MAFCSSCGKRADPEDRFCTGCGTPIKEQNITVMEETGNIIKEEYSMKNQQKRLFLDFQQVLKYKV